MRQRPRSRPRGLLGLFLGLLAVTGSASAQRCPEPPAERPDDAARAEARSLFRQGVACVRQQDFACAEERFRGALARVDASTVRYNLASTMHEQGRNVEALELARVVLECDEDVSRGIRAHAEELAREVRAAVGQLEISVDAPDGATVEVDGAALEPPTSTVMVEPGEHRIALRVRGEIAMERTVEVEAGGERAVELRYALDPSEVTRDAPADAALVAPSPPIHEEPAFWVGIVVVVAVVVLAVTVGVVLAVDEP